MYLNNTRCARALTFTSQNVLGHLHLHHKMCYTFYIYITRCERPLTFTSQDVLGLLHLHHKMCKVSYLYITGCDRTLTFTSQAPCTLISSARNSISCSFPMLSWKRPNTLMQLPSVTSLKEIKKFKK